MPKKNIEKIAYKQALADFREEYVGELKKNITVAIGIRDNTGETGKNRLEAIKRINDMLGIKSETKAMESKVAKSTKPSLKPEHREALDKIV